MPYAVTPEQVLDALDDATGGSASRAQTAVNLAAGWIIGRTSFTALDEDPIPADVWSAWLELATIWYQNPTALLSSQSGDVSLTWGRTEPGQRIAAILTTLASQYPRVLDSAQGAFPDPTLEVFWPDDARVTVRRPCGYVGPWPPGSPQYPVFPGWGWDQ
jgi:hypothetical protein